MATDTSTSRAVRVLADGRLEIPPDLQDELGIRAGTLVRLTVVDGELRIHAVSPEDAEQGSPWLRELYDYFAPVREEIATMGISDEEVNADIAEAIREVRAERAEQAARD